MLMHLLDDRLVFPNPLLADDEGLVAVGGDMSLERLLLAYRSGIFPWTVKPVTWWSPNPRGIIELDGLHVSRSLAKTLKREPFRVSFDTAFPQVIKACAASAPGRRTTWISPEFIRAYTTLHEQGHAHCVECWQEQALVGGIYGVAVGGLFAGESMFHRADNASKIAIYHLVQRLKQQGFALFDIQMVTPATLPLGAVEISREAYLRRLAEAVKIPCRFR
jgi:leucyl/phenylalanyl-tRNA--protein transferase